LILFTIFSAGVLAVILFWVTYNICILVAGIRRKSERTYRKTTESPRFSLIVPAKDEAPVIGRCLTALLNLDYPRDKMEIIVVDGNSKDATFIISSELSKKNPGAIKVLRESGSKGKPYALNVALPYVSGEIVGVFDADSVPEPGALHKISTYFGDQKVVAVQGKGKSLNAKSNLLTRIASVEEEAWFEALLAGREKLNLFIPLTGSCQFVRTEVLRQLGGWNEAALTEDVEFALRLVEKRYLVKYAPNVVSWQETPSSLNSLFLQRCRWYCGYMVAALKYGRLLKRVSRKVVDAEIMLFGPFVMLLCLVSYVNWAINLTFLPQTGLDIFFSAIIVALTTVSLLSVGIALVFQEPYIKLRSLIFIPFIYVYWLIQVGIVSWAFLHLFWPHRVWHKTIKHGIGTLK
jgi:cellulose synthase/poly-beta-1,6-N-acetylglucosamine synthase-like glycosyltransferase